jgi:hypothetical protein
VSRQPQNDVSSFVETIFSRQFQWIGYKNPALSAGIDKFATLLRGKLAAFRAIGRGWIGLPLCTKATPAAHKHAIITTSV